MSNCGGHCHGGNTTVRTILMDEHRVIERVLDAMERMLDEGVIDREFTLGAVDFIRNFADGCHHAKEEDHLFPALERAGVPREGGPVGCMLHEHEQGRLFVGQMTSSLDAAVAGRSDAIDAFRRAATGYISLLRQHIQKEDNILFVMAERALDCERKKELIAGFERSEEATPGKHEKYLALADRLANWQFRAAPVCA